MKRHLPRFVSRLRRLFRPARSGMVLGLGMAIGAGSLALGDIAISSSGVPSGTILTCVGKNGAMRYVRRGSCRRSERRLVLADRAPLIATLPAGGGPVAESPGVLLEGTAVRGDFEVQLSPKVVRNVRKCAYTATASVPPQGGHVTRDVNVVAAPLDSRHLLFHEFDSSGAVTSDGISISIYCP